MKNYLHNSLYTFLKRYNTKKYKELYAAKPGYNINYDQYGLNPSDFWCCFLSFKK